MTFITVSCIWFADFKSNFNFDQFLFSGHFFKLFVIIFYLNQLHFYVRFACIQGETKADVGKSTCASGQINIVAPAGHTQLVDFVQSEPRITFYVITKSLSPKQGK